MGFLGKEEGSFLKKKAAQQDQKAVVEIVSFAESVLCLEDSGAALSPRPGFESPFCSSLFCDPGQVSSALVPVKYGSHSLSSMVGLGPRQ